MRILGQERTFEAAVRKSQAENLTLDRPPRTIVCWLDERNSARPGSGTRPYIARVWQSPTVATSSIRPASVCWARIRDRPAAAQYGYTGGTIYSGPRGRTTISRPICRPPPISFTARRRALHDQARRAPAQQGRDQERGAVRLSTGQAMARYRPTGSPTEQHAARREEVFSYQSALGLGLPRTVRAGVAPQSTKGYTAKGRADGSGLFWGHRQLCYALYSMLLA